MKRLLAVVAILLASGCGGDGDGPSLDVFSDSEGTLHVDGSGWEGCTRVTVDLPEPWIGSESDVGEDGGFSLVYAHPLVKPYEGAVRVACFDSPERTVVAEIRVGDARAGAP